MVMAATALREQGAAARRRRRQWRRGGGQRLARRLRPLARFRRGLQTARVQAGAGWRPETATSIWRSGLGDLQTDLRLSKAITARCDPVEMAACPLGETLLRLASHWCLLHCKQQRCTIAVILAVPHSQQQHQRPADCSQPARCAAPASFLTCSAPTASPACILMLCQCRVALKRRW